MVFPAGFTLAYVVFAEAVTKLPIPQLWSILVFLMLFLLAIDSHFIMVHGLVVAIMDEFHIVIIHQRVAVIAVMCTLMYLLGLPMATEVRLFKPGHLIILYKTYILSHLKETLKTP